jgi:hypothetical protein
VSEAREWIPEFLDGVPIAREGLLFFGAGLRMLRERVPMERDGLSWFGDTLPMLRERFLVYPESAPMVREVFSVKGASLEVFGASVLVFGERVLFEGEAFPVFRGVSCE